MKKNEILIDNNKSNHLIILSLLKFNLEEKFADFYLAYRLDGILTCFDEPDRFYKISFFTYVNVCFHVFLRLCYGEECPAGLEVRTSHRG